LRDYWLDRKMTAAVAGRRMRPDEAGNLYYIDQNQPCVVKVNLAGQPIAAIGTPGLADGQPSILTSFTLDLQGNIYALKGSFPPRVQKLAP